MRVRASLLAGICASAIAFPAFAQETTEQDRAQPRYNDHVIIVTAQGRAQELADVPVAISAVSAETLENSGTTDIRELNQVAPSLLVSSTGNEANGSARIRGIGTVGDNPGLESSVAVFVDGVYRSRSGNALSELGPLDRIEILRGPQGTLGGRNSSAGMLNIFTAPPSFAFEGHASASFGNFNALRFEGGVNAPLSDSIAARIDGVWFQRDGFYTDVTNDTDVNNRDRYLVRAQVLFEPNDDVSFRLIGDYSKKDEACCAATFVQPDFAQFARVSPGLDPFAKPVGASPARTSTSNPIVNVLLGLGQDPRGLTQSTFDRNIYPTAGRSYDGETEDYGISGELNWSLGNVNFTSITAYREYANTQGSDTDYTTVDILYREPGDNAGARVGQLSDCFARQGAQRFASGPIEHRHCERFARFEAIIFGFDLPAGDVFDVASRFDPLGAQWRETAADIGRYGRVGVGARRIIDHYRRFLGRGFDLYLAHGDFDVGVDAAFDIHLARGR